MKAAANIFAPPGDAHCRVDALSLVHPARRATSVQVDAVRHLASTALIYSASSLMTDAFDLFTLSSYPLPVSASNAIEHNVSVTERQKDRKTVCLPVLENSSNYNYFSE